MTQGEAAGIWLTALALALGSGLAAGATDSGTAPGANSGNSQPEAITSDQESAGAGAVLQPQLERAADGTGLQLPVNESAQDGLSFRLPNLQMAQFELPRGTREGTPQTRDEARALAMPKELTYAYAYGSDSEVTYVKDADLDKRLRDNSIIFAPTVFGFIDYRPTDWLETRLELTLERLIEVREPEQITLPNGEVKLAAKKRLSLLVDQAYVTIKRVTAPFEFQIGRRNFEDGRLWLYDAALDAFVAKLKLGSFHTEASVSREDWVNGDLLINVPRGRTNNYMWYTEYRGIEDHKLAGYAIKRHDSTQQDGRPLLMGVRAYGTPSDKYNYWTELGFSRGRDELKRKLSGYAYDVGGTYRFPELRIHPSFTLAYAFGSGDGNPNDNKNKNFRQTGLQSNETRFGGVTQFKRYGETADPELSNLRIFTAGVGFRPAGNVFVDLVYHRYRLREISDQLRNSSITAQMNQDDTQLSRSVGSEFDFIIGFRNLFGIRRFGFEARAGWFLPGKAYRNEVDPDSGVFRPADKAISVLAVFIY